MEQIKREALRKAAQAAFDVAGGAKDEAILDLLSSLTTETARADALQGQLERLTAAIRALLPELHKLPAEDYARLAPIAHAAMKPLPETSDDRITPTLNPCKALDAELEAKG